MVLLITFSSAPASPIVAVDAHDDLFAGHGHQHGMALQRLGHVGDRAGPVEFVAGEKAGQLVGVFELGALAGVGGPLRRDEFEHEDGPLIVGGGQRPLHRLLHAEDDAVIDRQRNADPLALPAGTIFFVLRGGRRLRRRGCSSFCSAAAAAKRQHPATSASRTNPSRRGADRSAQRGQRYRSWKSLLPIIEWPARRINSGVRR